MIFIRGKKKKTSCVNYGEKKQTFTIYQVIENKTDLNEKQMKGTEDFIDTFYLFSKSVTRKTLTKLID